MLTEKVRTVDAVQVDKQHYCGMDTIGTFQPTGRAKFDSEGVLWFEHECSECIMTEWLLDKYPRLEAAHAPESE